MARCLNYNPVARKLVRPASHGFEIWDDSPGLPLHCLAYLRQFFVYISVINITPFYPFVGIFSFEGPIKQLVLVFCNNVWNCGNVFNDKYLLYKYEIHVPLFSCLLQIQ